MEITAEIIKTCKSWQLHRTINKSLVKKITRSIIQGFDVLKQVKQFELSILLTNNDEMLTLNQKFRNIPKPTNTLSFPDIELHWSNLIEVNVTNKRSMLEFATNLDYMYLGDIALGYEIIYEEALKQKKSFEHHFIHLLVHSILHLMGFDHKNHLEAEIMEELEVQILKTLNIPSPYIN